MADELRYVETVQSGNTADSTEIAHFVTKKAVPMESLKVTFSPIQEGSGDPSPSNVRSISGRTGVTVFERGKNLYDESTYPLTAGTWISGSAGSYSFDDECKATGEYIELRGLGSSIITLNKRPNGNNPGIAFYSTPYVSTYIGGVKNNWGTPGTPMTATVPSGSNYMRFCVPSTATDIQIELGSSATSYETYHGNEYTVDWQSVAETVYQGYIDLVSGTLTVTHKLLTLTGSEANAIYNWESYTLPVSDSVSSNSTYSGVSACSHAIKMCGGDIWSSANKENLPYVVASSSDSRIRFRNRNAGTSLEEYRTYLRGQYSAGTPVQIVYLLSTPITYQLSPQTIRTFLGINNVWSADGSVEVKYTPMAELNLMEYRRKMLLSTPHLETVSAGNNINGVYLASFTTDMAAPLKECKVSFEPHQKGTNLPSPTNVREIVGLTGLKLINAGANLFDKTKITEDYYVTQAGELVYNQYHWNVSDYIPVRPSEFITYKGLTTVGTAPGAAWYDKDKNVISGFKHAIGTNTLLVPFGAAYIRFSVYNGTDVNDPDTFMVQTGNVASSYESFDSEETVVDWQSVAGTIYGGYIDLVKGELVAEYIEVPVSSIRYIQSSSTYDQLRLSLTSAIISNIKTIMSNMFSTEATSGTVGKMSRYDSDIYFNIPLNQLETVDSPGAQKWYQDYHPQFICELNEPIHYSLSPQIVKAIKGLNNMWVDEGGTVDIKYWNLKLQSELPKEYRKVEYLEQNGYNTRIDTGVPGNDDTLEFDFIYIALEQYNYGAIFGSYANENTKCWRVIQANTSNPRTYIYTANTRKAGSSNTIIPISSSKTSIVNEKVHFHVSLGKCSSEDDAGLIKSNSSADDGTTDISSNNICIGAARANMTGTAPRGCFYGTFKIWSQGNLIRNYIPCYRKSDHKSGFYDTVNNTFNPSIGSADFGLPSA